MPGNKITLVGIYCIKRNIPMGKVKDKIEMNFDLSFISIR